MAESQLATVLITLDTSALYATLNRYDRDHSRVQAILERERAIPVIPVAILGEIAYLVEDRLSRVAMVALVRDFRARRYQLDSGESDFDRVEELIERYADFPLGFVDAAVVACAERHGGRVLTLDLRHFGAVAREGTITLPLLDD